MPENSFDRNIDIDYVYFGPHLSNSVLFCPFLSCSVCYLYICQFLPFSVPFCLLMLVLSVLSVCVCFCPFLLNFNCFCPFLFVDVCFWAFLCISVRFCAFLTIFVRFCQLLLFFYHKKIVLVTVYPFPSVFLVLSAIVHFCPFLSVSVPFFCVLSVVLWFCLF